MHFVQLSKGIVKEDSFVELVKDLVVLDPMKVVLQRLLYVLNGVTVSVQHTNLEILNVDLDLIM